MRPPTTTVTALPSNLHAIAFALAAALLAACAPRSGAAPAPSGPATTAPQHLATTGLYADFAARTLAADVLPFTPQYPLWTDGAAKQRWIALPPGSAIDASDVDHWQFPIGTRLWKQFAFERAAETRYMQRLADGSWLYAAYVWNDDGTDAVKAPDDGVRGVCATADGQRHDVPGVADCRICHEGGRTPVLGFSALQLSPDRDPLAPHATPRGEHDVDLHTLAARGLLRDLPARWQLQAPRIAARDARERAALGYLHGNCSSCHNADGPLQRLGLRFDHSLASDTEPPAIATAVGVDSKFTRGDIRQRIAPGDPAHSAVVLRLCATDALTQMPPFGRHLADRDAVALLTQWIQGLTASPSLTANHNRPREK